MGLEENKSVLGEENILVLWEEVRDMQGLAEELCLGLQTISLS